MTFCIFVSMIIRYTLLLAIIFLWSSAYSQDWDALNTEYKEQIVSQDYENALKTAEKILKTAEDKLDRKDPNYIRALDNLAVVHECLEHYDRAVEYRSEIWKIELLLLEDKYPTFAVSLSSTGEMYKSITDNKTAVKIYTKAIDRIRQLDTIDYNVIYDLTMIYSNTIMEQYGGTTAASTDKDLISSTKEKFGNNSKEYTDLLDSLGTAYKTYAKYPQAIDIFNELKDILKSDKKVNTYQYAKICADLGYLYFLSQKHDHSMPYYEEAIKVFRNIKKTRNEDYTNSLVYYGMVYMMKQDWQKGTEIFEEALPLVKDVLGKDSPYYSLSLIYLGSAFSMLKEYEKAEHYYLEDIKYKKNKGDTMAANYMADYSGLGLIYEKTNRYDKADEIYLEYSQAIIDMINQMFRIVTVSSEKKVAQYFIWFEYNLNSFYSYFFKRYKDNPLLPAQMYNAEIIKKGIILKAIKSNIAIIQNSGDTALISSFNQWLDIRQKLSKLYILPVSERKANVSELERQAKDIENKMYYKVYKEKENKDISLDWKKIRDKLKDNEAAVEFLNFDYFDMKGNIWSDTSLYCALVLRKEYKYPKLVYLFEGNEFSGFLSRNKGKGTFDRIRRLYSWFTGDDRNLYKGDSLYNYVWKPIAPLLQGVDRIYYSPSGLLHKIAFSAVPVDKDSILLDRYSLQQMSSTGLLAFDKDPFNISEEYEALLYGGIFYDLDPNSLGNTVNKYKDEHSDFFIHDRSFEWARSLSRGSWSYLQGTLDEVENIDSLFSDYNVKTTVLTKDMALEESFKYDNDDMPEIIHIATHGFFFPEKKVEKKERNMAYNDIMYQKASGDDILLRSGLLFAGANHVWKGNPPEPGFEDGILTAYEVSKMNLYNTRLVVLSACETGLGDIRGSEGVYGLQRAFKLAGVDYVIMSLWQIPDRQTVELMSIFYREWLEGKNIRDAFNEAQRKMSEKYDPFYWAAFVLVE